MEFKKTTAVDKILEMKNRIKIIQGGCLAKGTKVLLNNLTYKKVEDVKVGDKLMGIDGGKRNVLKLCRGKSQLYKVKQKKGIDYTVNDEHILVLEDQGRDLRKSKGGVRKYVGRERVAGLHKFKAEEFHNGSKRSTARRYKGIKTGLVFDEKKVLLDPYYLGLWLGDGSSHNAQITNIDSEVIDFLYNDIPKLYDVNVGQNNSDKISVKITKKTGRCNDIIQRLKHYNLILNKHIPIEYIKNSREVRLNVLAGLIDSDGHLERDSKTKKTKGYSICQKRKRLSDDILLLCRTLGFYCTQHIKKTKMKREDGSVYKCDTYTVAIYLKDYKELPVKVKRKKCLMNNYKNPLRSSIELEKLEVGDYYGFELDGDHLFLLEDFTITHNTSAGKTLAILLILIDIAQSQKQLLISVVSETMPHLKKGAIRDFLSVMEAHKYYNEDSWNRTDKIYTFDTGTKIEFFSADSPDKVRGPRRDVLFINECNNISYEVYTQLSIRTNKEIYLDYNPVSEFWALTELRSKKNTDFIILTYLDNEGLSQAIIDDIESRKHNKNFWKVYGLGELGEIEGRIYTNWKMIDEIPHEARLERFGLDFGYSVDYSAIVAIYFYNGGYILDEILFRKGMSNKQLADVFLNIDRALVIADSAEPKSIDEIASYGINIIGAVKGADSVRQGISFVQDQKISVTSRSLNLIKAYRNYLWKTDKEGKILNVPDHAFSDILDALRYGLANQKIMTKFNYDDFTRKGICSKDYS